MKLKLFDWFLRLFGRERGVLLGVIPKSAIAQDSMQPGPLLIKEFPAIPGDHLHILMRYVMDTSLSQNAAKSLCEICGQYQKGHLSIRESRGVFRLYLKLSKHLKH